MVDVNKLFGSEVLTRYPSSLKAEQLRHKFSEHRLGATGRPIPFERVFVLLDELNRDITEWHEEETGERFNRYRLAERIDRVRQKYWEDQRFVEAFKLLGLDPLYIERIRLPWWNEIAANEVAHTTESDGILVQIGQRHSFETQLVRSGIDLPITSVSVGGIIETCDGFIVIGLRGGVAFPNTYHINAGALGITEGIKNGAESIYDFYGKRGLLAEFGLSDDCIASATVLSRVMDYSIENGTMYVFYIKTNLSFGELETQYESNLDIDKGQHTRLICIRNTPEEIMRFIRQNYKGVITSREDRKDNERYLLHPGALALLSHTNMPLDALRSIFKEGVW